MWKPEAKLKLYQMLHVWRAERQWLLFTEDLAPKPRL